MNAVTDGATRVVSNPETEGWNRADNFRVARDSTRTRLVEHLLHLPRIRVTDRRSTARAATAHNRDLTMVDSWSFTMKIFAITFAFLLPAGEPFCIIASSGTFTAEGGPV